MAPNLYGNISTPLWCGRKRRGLGNLKEPPYQPTRGTQRGKRGSTRLFPSD